MQNSTLLTWMTFTPILGVVAVLVLVAARHTTRGSKDLFDNLCRLVGLATTGAVLLMGIYLWAKFDTNPEGLGKKMQFVHHFVWLKSFNIEYFVGVDGLSVAMVILTSLIGFVAMIASLPWWGEVDHHHFSQRMVPGYIAMFLLLMTGMIGTFVSLDLFLFYVFWEVMLLPMYFLIGIWGGPRKEYAAIKFFLYTLFGSVLMLLAIIALYYNSAPTMLADGTMSNAHTFNMTALIEQGMAGQFMKAAPILGFAFSKIIFIALFIGFAIKVPMFPFHTWLPDAHVEAPTPISVILAGVLLKLGGYGMLRICFGFLPEAAQWAATGIAVFGVINIVYAAFVCLAQRDLKKLIAYSSVSHMGFVLLGMASLNQQGITGAVFQMWSHGIVSPMLFLLVGVVYDRAHTRDIQAFGGIAKQVPEYTGLTGLAFFASLGLPGLAGFVGEVLVFIGAFGSTQASFKLLVVISASAVIITAAYYLYAMQRMFLGKFNEGWRELKDLFWRERLTLYPLAVGCILFGFYPIPIFELVNPKLFELMYQITHIGHGL